MVPFRVLNVGYFSDYYSYFSASVAGKSMRFSKTMSNYCRIGNFFL
jgi:hypothetical protein